MESIVAPNWVKEPNDIRVNAGNDVSVECIADGLPKPTIKWISSKGLKFFFNTFSANKSF
jgi:hypothetical protein